MGNKIGRQPHKHFSVVRFQNRDNIDISCAMFHVVEESPLCPAPWMWESGKKDKRPQKLETRDQASFWYLSGSLSVMDSANLHRQLDMHFPFPSGNVP